MTLGHDTVTREILDSWWSGALANRIDASEAHDWAESQLEEGDPNLTVLMQQGIEAVHGLQRLYATHTKEDAAQSATEEKQRWDKNYDTFLQDPALWNQQYFGGLLQRTYERSGDAAGQRLARKLVSAGYLTRSEAAAVRLASDIDRIEGPPGSETSTPR